MRVFHDGFKAGAWAPSAVVAIGKFDGMHVGHQKLVRAAVRRAAALKTRCLILTFDPSPREFLQLYPYRPLLTIAERIGRFKSMGIDGVVLLPFNKELACLSPESFVNLVLAAQLKAMEIFVGQDFCFGKDRGGDVATLKRLGRQFGFRVHPVALIRVNGEKVSATRIRRLLEAGQREKARRLLGAAP